MFPSRPGRAVARQSSGPPLARRADGATLKVHFDPRPSSESRDATEPADRLATVRRKPREGHAARMRKRPDRPHAFRRKARGAAWRRRAMSFVRGAPGVPRHVRRHRLPPGFKRVRPGRDARGAFHAHQAKRGVGIGGGIRGRAGEGGARVGAPDAAAESPRAPWRGRASPCARRRGRASPCGASVNSRADPRGCRGGLAVRPLVVARRHRAVAGGVSAPSTRPRRQCDRGCSIVRPALPHAPKPPARLCTFVNPMARSDTAASALRAPPAQ